MSPEITSDEALEVYRSVCHRTGAFETASNMSKFLARVVEIQALQELGLHTVSPPPVNLEEQQDLIHLNLPEDIYKTLAKICEAGGLTPWELFTEACEEYIFPRYGYDVGGVGPSPGGK